MNPKSRKFMSSFLSASSVAAFGAGALLVAGSAFGEMRVAPNRVLPKWCACNTAKASRCKGSKPKCSTHGPCGSTGGGSSTFCAGSCGCKTGAASVCKCG